MKRFFLSLILSFCIYNCHAQWFSTSGITYSLDNIGIGSSTPVGKFDIYSSANTMTNPLVSLRSNFHVSGNYGMIRFGDYTQSSNYQKGAIIYESVSASARGKFHIALENTDGNGSVTLLDSKFTILPNGNVGIGTVDPDEKLAVNGIIHSKAVRVDMTGWSDYVFNDGYQLTPLSQLKTFIAQNNHLPEIPSAAEVEKNGQDLGEMNKLLLKKVEELTLYLIELDKKVERQNKEITRLKKKKK
jgi:hypothetical protein